MLDITILLSKSRNLKRNLKSFNKFNKMLHDGNKKLIKESYLLCALDLTQKEIDEISEENEILMDFRKRIEKLMMMKIL